MLVSILCLFSVYYYGSMAGFRYYEDSSHDLTTTIVLEGIFFLHMFLQFFVNTKKLDGSLKKKSLETIAYDYYSTNFALDLITNIPFFFIDLKRKR
jgi:hypothetical protein